MLDKPFEYEYELIRLMQQNRQIFVLSSYKNGKYICDVFTANMQGDVIYINDLLHKAYPELKLNKADKIVIQAGTYAPHTWIGEFIYCKIKIDPYCYKL